MGGSSLPVDLHVMYMFRTKQALMITKEYKCDTLVEYNACAVTSAGAIVEAGDKFWHKRDIFDAKNGIGFLLLAGSTIAPSVTLNGQRNGRGRIVKELLETIHDKNIVCGNILKKNILLCGRMQLTLLVAGYDTGFKACWIEIPIENMNQHFLDFEQRALDNTQVVRYKTNQYEEDIQDYSEPLLSSSTTTSPRLLLASSNTSTVIVHSSEELEGIKVGVLIDILVDDRQISLAAGDYVESKGEIPNCHEVYRFIFSFKSSTGDTFLYGQRVLRASDIHSKISLDDIKSPHQLVATCTGSFISVDDVCDKIQVDTNFDEAEYQMVGYFDIESETFNAQRPSASYDMISIRDEGLQLILSEISAPTQPPSGSTRGGGGLHIIPNPLPLLHSYTQQQPIHTHHPLHTVSLSHSNPQPSPLSSSMDKQPRRKRQKMEKNEIILPTATTTTTTTVAQPDQISVRDWMQSTTKMLSGLQSTKECDEVIINLSSMIIQVNSLRAKFK